MLLSGLFAAVSVVWMRAIKGLGVQVEAELAKVEVEGAGVDDADDSNDEEDRRRRGAATAPRRPGGGAPPAPANGAG